MEEYTSKHICSQFNITQARLSQFINGRQVKRGGRVEWTEDALLSEQDYDRTANGIVFYPSALKKISDKIASK